MSEKIDAELVGVETDRVKAEETNQAIRKETADFRVPDVLEYVKETASLQVWDYIDNYQNDFPAPTTYGETHREGVLEITTKNPNWSKRGKTQFVFLVLCGHGHCTIHFLTSHPRK